MILFETVLQDLRYGARTLLRNFRFTAVSIVALALGIGVNTAVFTAYKAFVIRPLDAREPDTMANVSLRLQSGAMEARFSYPDYEAYRDQLRSFSGVIAFTIDQQLRPTGTEHLAGQRSAEAGSLMGRLGILPPSVISAEPATTFFVSENYFAVLGVRAVAGRTFDAISLRDLAAAPAVLISENYWQRRFGGDPAILGTSIRLNGAAFTIIGITPHDFVGTSVAVPDFWFPLSLDPLVHPERSKLRDRDTTCCRVWGRLAPGVTRAQAQAEMSTLVSQLRMLHDPQSNLGIGKEVSAVISPGSPLPGKPNAGLQLAIALIMIGVAMVLVIACANAASLQLARATTRQQELGLRLSLGASRSRLIRQLLTESALIGVLAGAVALPMTWLLMRVAVTKVAEAMPVGYGTIVLNVTPDLAIFAYVLGISVSAGIVFGLAPAIESSRSALSSTIRGGGGGGGAAVSPGRSRLRQVLIAAQVAVSLALMIAGGLLVRSANQALTMETGYDGERVINLRLTFPEEGHYTTDHQNALVRDLRTRLVALPSVAAVTSGKAPDEAGGGRRAAVSLDGQHPSTRNTRALIFYTWVQPNYFETLGIPLVAGRPMPSRSGQPEPSVVLSESAARRLWPTENAIGRSLRLGTDSQFHNTGELLPDGQTWQVIAIARDTRGVTIDGSDSAQVYIPLPADRIQDYPLLVRTTADPALVMRAIEPVLAAADSNVMASMSTLQDMLRRSDAFLLASISAAIASTISLFGLLLAGMGIYSTVSYLVVLRTHEVGIRMAIGASSRDILLLMLQESARPVMAGLLAGIAVAAAMAQLLRGALYGLTTLDLTSFAAASVFFLIIATIATILPSRRALRIDPLVALRYE